LQELQESAENAQSLWNLNQLQLALQVNAESCEENDGSMELTVGQPGTAQLLLFNGDGVELTGQDIVESSFTYEGMPAGDYTLAFDFFDGTSEEVDFTIENSDPVSITEITASSEIVVLPEAAVDFSIVDDGASDYLWDFGDGNTSTDQTPSHTYTEAGTYIVTCTASNENCSETSTLTIEVGTTVSIRDLNDAFVIYPNPAQEILNVNLGNSLEVELISLIDLSGRTVAEVSKSNQISVSHLANGTYFVRVMSEGKQWMKKIQVIR